MQLLKEICKLSGLSPIRMDTCGDFLSQPHCCQLLQQVDLSVRPQVPKLEEFLNLVKQKISMRDFHWRGNEEGCASSADDNSLMKFAVSTKWSYGSLRSSTFHSFPVRDGHSWIRTSCRSIIYTNFCICLFDVVYTGPMHVVLVTNRCLQ